MNTPFRFPIRRSGKATEYYLSVDKRQEYIESYPGIQDIDQEFREMRQWCIDNPAKRKTERGMPKFISAWLTRSNKKTNPFSTRSRSLHQDLNDKSWAN